MDKGSPFQWVIQEKHHPQSKNSVTEKKQSRHHFPVKIHILVALGPMDGKLENSLFYPAPSSSLPPMSLCLNRQRSTKTYLDLYSKH